MDLHVVEGKQNIIWSHDLCICKITWFKKKKEREKGQQASVLLVVEVTK